MSQAGEAISTSTRPVPTRRAFVLGTAVAGASTLACTALPASAIPGAASSVLCDLRSAARAFAAAKHAVEARNAAWLTAAQVEQRFGVATRADLLDFVCWGHDNSDDARGVLAELTAAWQTDHVFVELYDRKDAAGRAIQGAIDSIRDRGVGNLADLDELAECIDIAVNVFGDDEAEYVDLLVDAVRSVAGGAHV